MCVGGYRVPWNLKKKTKQNLGPEGLEKKKSSALDGEEFAAEDFVVVVIVFVFCLFVS